MINKAITAAGNDGVVIFCGLCQFPATSSVSVVWDACLTGNKLFGKIAPEKGRGFGFKEKSVTLKIPLPPHQAANEQSTL